MKAHERVVEMADRKVEKKDEQWVVERAVERV